MAVYALFSYEIESEYNHTFEELICISESEQLIKQQMKLCYIAELEKQIKELTKEYEEDGDVFDASGFGEDDEHYEWGIEYERDWDKSGFVIKQTKWLGELKGETK